MKVFLKTRRTFYLEKEGSIMSFFSREKFKLNYFNRFVFTLNLVVILIAYTIYLNKIFTPTQIPYFNFISIGFPIIFLIISLFLCYWLLISFRRFLITLLLSSGLFYPIYLSYPLINLNKKSSAISNLSVMTFNAHGFKADGTLDLVEQNLTDVMIFQEAREGSQKKWAKHAIPGYYKEYYDLLTIYSKYPIIQTSLIEDTELSNSGKAAYADIDLGFDTVRIINLYMEPMYIEKSLVKDVISSDTTEEIELTSKKIENKLVNGMRVHEKQLDYLLPFIQKSPHPVLLASDLNSTPSSYEYEMLTKHLEDSFIQAGEGNGTTFHSFKFPIRIDYIFHSKEFEVVEAKVVRKKFSDHFPVIVNYKLHNK